MCDRSRLLLGLNSSKPRGGSRVVPPNEKCEENEKGSFEVNVVAPLGRFKLCQGSKIFSF